LPWQPNDAVEVSRICICVSCVGREA
jgi:hypothetical protein